MLLMKDQKRELDQTKHSIVLLRRKTKKLKLEKAVLENENVALRNGLQNGVAAQFDSDSD